MIKRFILIFSVLALLLATGCGGNNDKKDPVDDNENDDKNELYSFLQTYLDYKEASFKEIEAKKNDFDETVKNLASDFGIDLPIAPLKQVMNVITKEGTSWTGTSSVWEYEVTKEGDVYKFTFNHTMLEEVTEGECNPKEGTLFLTVTGVNVNKYQVKRISKGEYIRFWSEKSDYLNETRTHHTYFKGKNIACGQDEELEPKELIGSQYKDVSYVELLGHWVKLMDGKTSDSARG